MSGVVFHHIAEGVMARHLKLSVDDACDGESVVVPDVKNGDMAEATQVLHHFNIKTSDYWDVTGVPVWGKAERRTNDVALTKMNMPTGKMPDVIGMGAKDAVFMLESRGLKVRLQGRGKVKSQSCPAGSNIAKGSTCVLVLQ